jgi:hypothetical protein
MRKRVSESSKGKIISEKQKEKIRKIQKERMKNLNVRKEHSIKMKEWVMVIIVGVKSVVMNIINFIE